MIEKIYLETSYKNGMWFDLVTLTLKMFFFLKQKYLKVTKI